MNDDHLALQHSIADYIAHRLDDEARTRLETHLARCVCCQELVASGEAIAAWIRASEDPELQPHPPTGTLRAFASEPGPTSRTNRSIKGHLEYCPSCALEVDVFKTSANALNERREGTAGGTYRRRWSFAAGLAAGIVLVMLTLWSLDGLGRPERAWDGAAEILWLEEVRGSGTEPPTLVAADSAVVVLAIAGLALPSDGSAGDRLAFELVEVGRDEILWGRQDEAARILEQQKRSGVFVLVLPSEATSSGDYWLRVRGVEAAADELIAEFRFRIVAQPSPP